MHSVQCTSLQRACYRQAHITFARLSFALLTCPVGCLPLGACTWVMASQMPQLTHTMQLFACPYTSFLAHGTFLWATLRLQRLDNVRAKTDIARLQVRVFTDGLCVACDKTVAVQLGPALMPLAAWLSHITPGVRCPTCNQPHLSIITQSCKV